MSARGRFVSCLATAVVALSGFVTVGALPAAGGAGRVVEYVALGDSYAAGWGGGERYFNGDCKQSAQGYPALLDAQERIDLVANATCKGAKTSDVINTQLSALKPDTRLVTLTVGGNDLDVSGLANLCLTEPANCIAEINLRLTTRLPKLGPALIELYATVAAQAPDARIVVTGYPHLFEPAPGSPNADIIDAINKATDQLNATIKEAVTVTQNADVNIRYVDVVPEFAGHGLVIPFNPNAFINPPGHEAAFHPNAAGYRAYADAIFDALPGGWLDKTSRIAASP